MEKVKMGTQKAKELTATCKYLYGGNGQKYTTALVNKLAKQYPGMYTAALKKEALKDANKGYIAADCSYLVSAALGIARTNSSQIRSKAIKALPIIKAEAREGMALWRDGHVAYIGDDLKVYEMRSTKADASILPFDKRANDFTYMFIVKGSYLDQELKEQPVIYYPATPAGWNGSSIVSALAAVGEKDTGINHRKKIAAANGVKDYIGSAKQNLQLVALIKAGRLIKA